MERRHAHQQIANTPLNNFEFSSVSMDTHFRLGNLHVHVRKTAKTDSALLKIDCQQWQQRLLKVAAVAAEQQWEQQ